MKTLLTRIEKLEQGNEGAELPNGGLLMVAVAHQETNDAALSRAMRSPRIAGLSDRQKGRLIPVFVSPQDMEL
jgi:hypothetical protein